MRTFNPASVNALPLIRVSGDMMKCGEGTKTMSRYWQDLARTIPAVNDGDPVAVMDGDVEYKGHKGYLIDLIQPDPSLRPTLREITEPQPDFVVGD